MENVRQHTFTLARYTYAALSALRYPNGAPVVRIYSDSEFSSPEVQGPVISFNVLDDHGRIIGYSQVDKMASLYNIHVRTGCFCNTGACQRHLGISDEMVKKHLQAGHVCGDDVDLIDGQPTGSVRISFGYMSTLEDAQAFLRFIIATHLCPPHGQQLPLATPGEAGAPPTGSEAQDAVPAIVATRSPSPQEDAPPDARVWNNSLTTVHAVGLCPPLLEATGTQLTPSEKAAGVPDGDLGSRVITNLYIYPIKSCAAFEVTRWPLGNQGLLYDRSWMVVNHNGICLSQKQEPRLCLIQPFIDLQRRIMVIQARACRDWVGPGSNHGLKLVSGNGCTGLLSSAVLCGAAGPGGAGTRVCTTSDENGKEELFPMKDLISRFRANIITNGTRAFEEENWDEVSIGSLRFQVLGPCHRCQMICIDQQTGQRNKDIFQKLSERQERQIEDRGSAELLHLSVILTYLSAQRQQAAMSTGGTRADISPAVVGGPEQEEGLLWETRGVQEGGKRKGPAVKSTFFDTTGELWSVPDAHGFGFVFSVLPVCRISGAPYVERKHRTR
ncbi:molybdenum cofactor sulfurase-like protein [Camelus ferus]|nr:molybdenum cofactor sulfurase-like protein [Camelus ferus]